MKKVLHIIHNASTGGAQVLLRDLFQQWKKTDIEFVLVTHQEGHYLEDYQVTGHKVYSINFSQSDVKILFALRKIIQQEQPDYIHNHLWKASLLGSFAALPFSKVQILNQIHGVVADTDRAAWKLRVYSTLLRALARTRARFVAVSEYECRRLKEGGVSKSAIQLIYNGAAVEKFVFSSQTYQSKEALKLLFVGRLEQVKGVRYLLEAVKGCSPQQVQVSIVGDGALRESLEAFCRVHRLEHVHFLGFVKNVQQLIAEHHVFVAPSLWEVFGISIAEAMAMGKAVIASKVGGIPELIIADKGGYLCPPADSNALGEAIKKLQEQPEKIAAFGIYNRQRFEEHFTFQHTLRQFEQLYL